MDPEDFDLLTRTVAGEAGNDPSASAVAHSILNRLNSGQYGKNISSVVFAPHQYEVWNTPKSANALAQLDTQSPKYQQAAAVVAQAVNGGQDPTNGATNYYSPSGQAALGRAPPKWDDGSGVMIGTQKFFGGTPDYIAQIMQADAQNSQNSQNASQTGIIGQQTAATPDYIAQTIRADTQDAQQTPDYIAQTMKADQGTSSFETPQQRIQDLIGAQPSPKTDELVFDRSAPISQQLSTAAQLTGQYVGGQIAGIPAAIGNNYSAAKGLMGQGLNDIGQGHLFPSFPSSDPSTWGAGGLLKTAAGGLGIPYSPISGVVDQVVTDPITQATGNPEIGMRAGIVANALLPNAVGGLLRGAPANAETLRLADVANANNIPIRAPQISNNAFIQKLDQIASSIPGSGADAQAATQQNAFTQAVSRTFGENTPQITRQTVADAQRRIGGVLNNIEQKATVPIDDTLLSNLANVEQNARQTFGPDTAQYSRIDDQINRVFGVAQQNNGVIPGSAFGTLIHKGSPLDNLISGQDTDVARQATGIKSALMDAMQRNVSPEDAQAYTEARFQYKNLKTIEPLVTKGTPGEISPLALNQRVNSQFGTTNAGPLGQLADTAQRFMRKPPNSGTPLGNLAVNALTFPGALVGGAIAGGNALGFSPMETVGLGFVAPGVTAGTARATNMLLNNPIYKNALLRAQARTSLLPGAFSTLASAPGNPSAYNALQPTP
jgi:hypothetical protein